MSTLVKVMLSMLCAVAALAGCTSASGPTYSANSIVLANGEEAFRVTCYGLFGGSGVCHSKAREICGTQLVRTLEDLAPQGSSSSGKPNTRMLTFQCGAPSQPVAAVEPQRKPMPELAPIPAHREMSLNGDANFDTDKSTLKAPAKFQLDKFLADSRGRTSSRATVSGYADSTGSVGHNQRLSERRAQTVANYLRGQGLNAGAWDVHGFGAENPIASNSTAEGRARNRRVEVKLDQ